MLGKQTKLADLPLKNFKNSCITEVEKSTHKKNKIILNRNFFF